MIFPFAAALVFTLATLLPLVLFGGIWRVFGGARARYWRRVLWLHAMLFPLHLLVTFPVALAGFGSRGLGTRGDEGSYAGPRLDEHGRILVQSKATLKAERESGVLAVEPAVATAAANRAMQVASSDGVTLRVFRVEAQKEPPVAAVVLVHGLFRSALEVEPVANMLLDLGCECWLLEQRNHGGSSRAPFTGGVRESDDVVATVQFVRSQPNRANVPVGLFGVSLGTIAVALATPRIERLGGIVLDAPMEDLEAAAHRMLSFQRRDDRRSWLRLEQPWRSLVIVALETWSGFRMADAVPITVLANLPPDVPVLVFGGELDDRAPPDRVQALFEQLSTPPERKQLWIAAGSGHGDVWKDDPAGYAERLAWWVERLRR